MLISHRIPDRHCISAGSRHLPAPTRRPLEARGAAGGGAPVLGGHPQRHRHDDRWHSRSPPWAGIRLSGLVWGNVVIGGRACACAHAAICASVMRRPRRAGLQQFPLRLIAVGAWMYFAAPAAEYVLGGRDPGVYINEGIQIAQRQSLVTTDRVAAAVPASARDLFFPSYSNPAYYSIRFMGFPLRDPEHGHGDRPVPAGLPDLDCDRVRTGRRHGHAARHRMVGDSRRTGGVFRGSAPRRAASGGRGCRPAVRARHTNLVRAISQLRDRHARLWSSPALLAHAYAHEDDDRFFGAVAASLLGLALFTRLPAVLVVGVAIAASLLPHVKGRRGRVGFLVTLAAWVIAAGAYYATQLGPYIGRPIAYAQSLQPIQLAVSCCRRRCLSALLWASRRPRVAAATRTLLPTALIAIVLTGGLYALFFREPGGGLAPHDAHAVRIFASLYFTPIGFGLALAGYALLVWRSFWRAPALILVITALTTVFFYKMRIWPEHFWLARRFLTEILPGALIFASAAMFAPVWMKGSWLDSRRSSRVAFTAVGVLAAVLLGYRYLSASLPIRQHVEYADVIPRARAARVQVHRQRSRAGRGARRFGSACARAALVVYLRAQCARPLRLAPGQAGCPRVPHVGARTVRERVFHCRRRNEPVVARRRLDRCFNGELSGAGVREDHLRHLPARGGHEAVRLHYLQARTDGVDSTAAFAGHRRHGRPSPRGLLSQGKAWRRQSDVSMEPGHVVSAHERPACRAAKWRSG